MPIPLNKLAGAELLPQNLTVDSYKNFAQIAYNKAVDDLGTCAININAPMLFHMFLSTNINKEASNALRSGKSILINIQDIRDITEAIASQPEKILKIVRVSDEVIK